RLAGRQLVLLHRKPQRVDERLLVRDNLAGRREPADRFGVVEELFLGHEVEALEVPPPRWARLARVIFEELAGKPADRPDVFALDQPLPKRSTLAVVFLLLFVALNDGRP